MNTQKIIEKYLDPSFLMFSIKTVKYTNSKASSTKFCQELGISLALEQAKHKKTKAKVKLNIVRIVELVIDKSMLPKLIGIILIIANCSNGELVKNNIKISKNYKSKLNGVILISLF